MYAAIIRKNEIESILKPVAKTAGVNDFDFRAMRATASTLIQEHGLVKDIQEQMRRADPTTLRHYVKVIPENQRKAVADFERGVMTKSRRNAVLPAQPGGEVMKS